MRRMRRSVTRLARRIVRLVKRIQRGNLMAVGRKRGKNLAPWSPNLRPLQPQREGQGRMLGGRLQRSLLRGLHVRGLFGTVFLVSVPVRLSTRSRRHSAALRFSTIQIRTSTTPRISPSSVYSGHMKRARASVVLDSNRRHTRQGCRRSHEERPQEQPLQRPLEMRPGHLVLRILTRRQSQASRARPKEALRRPLQNVCGQSSGSLATMQRKLN
mmetsp:Transcript_70553/g.206490  ORF Transcript_70553/g.206490 Transcript_70553/m.206490 type:complete len:214 (+) Transcript_70553:291-932(+)